MQINADTRRVDSREAITGGERGTPESLASQSVEMERYERALIITTLLSARSRALRVF